MDIKKFSFLCLAIYLFSFASSILADSEQKFRIVSASGAITETICELGFGQRLVGVDMSSKFPENIVDSLPVIGHGHSLNAEGILALRPSHVFVMDARRSNTLVEQLKKAEVTVYEIPYPKKVKDSFKMIRAIAVSLKVEEKGEKLVQRVEEDLTLAKKHVEKMTKSPKALFVYARGMKTLYVGGTGTLAESLINEAGATNCVSTFSSYQPLTAENIIQASPDVYVAFKSGVQSVGGIEGFLKLPGVGLTMGGRFRRIVLIDDAALNFGPRIGQFVLQVSKEFEAIL